VEEFQLPVDHGVVIGGSPQRIHGAARRVEQPPSAVVKYACGEAMLRACFESYTDEMEHRALEQHCGGQTPKYNSLLAELEAFKEGEGFYEAKKKAVDVVVKGVVAQALEHGPEPPLARLIKCLALSAEVLKQGVTFFVRLKKDIRRTPTAQQLVFWEFAINTLSVVGTATAVERVNKNHGHVLSVGRAAMGEKNRRRAAVVV